MKVFQLLDGINVIGYGSDVNFDADVTGICFDSRYVKEGDAFFAYRGTGFDSNGVLEEIYKKKPALIVGEVPNEKIPMVAVQNGRHALALACKNFYENPDEELIKIGITGTNGKTTVSYIIQAIMLCAGHKAMRFGTTGYNIGEKTYDAATTTPTPLEFYGMMREGADLDYDCVISEVSSHALEQDRLYGTKFDVSVFTNLTGDHLDFHGDMESYFESKSKLFTLEYSNVGVINLDSDYGLPLKKKATSDVITFGLNPRSEVTAKEVWFDISGIKSLIEYPGGSFNIESKLVGLHNLENILAATSACIALGIDEEAIIEGIKTLENVPGRLERFNKGGANIFVDYAHTDDALKNVLEALTPFKKGKLICVFGCGGDRDKTKRPRMAKVAEQSSDIIIVTNDNPRTEDPYEIIRDIMSGFTNAESVIICPDRKEAIYQACEKASDGDIVLIAGKGHEDYMVIGKEKTHFDDREEVIRYLEDFGWI